MHTAAISQDSRNDKESLAWAPGALSMGKSVFQRRGYGKIHMWRLVLDESGRTVEARVKQNTAVECFSENRPACVTTKTLTRASIYFLPFPFPPPPPLLSLKWTYFAEIEKPLPAGECYPHGSHSTFPEVGRCDCARSKHGFYTRTSGSWIPSPMFSFLPPCIPLEGWADH